MTEVRDTLNGKGLFASKAFQKGSLILEESPLVKVAPSDEEAKALFDKFWGNKKKSTSSSSGESSTTLWSVIVPPLSIPKASHGRYRAMVQAGLCWLESNHGVVSEADQEILFQLYHPQKDSAKDLEKDILTLSSEAVGYLKGRGDFKNTPDWTKVEKLLGIWACNSFEGGRLYPQISRINHDCNPNAIVKADGDSQRIVAAVDISAGDEICISYLGLLLYAETRLRKNKLKAAKFFDCQCQRCNSSDDPAGFIPCATCHARELPQQSLDEDTQYDDEQTVNYVSPGSTCLNCKLSPQLNKKLQIVMENVSSKMISYLDSLEQKGKADNMENDGEEDTVVEEHLGLASSIMGDRHWTTNLMRLIFLDRRLSIMSQAMLTTQQLPDMEDVAETIDNLQRVERFVFSLKLGLEAGHVLGDAIIGVARTLVSLGDVKSQKYGAEWLDKISDYVGSFESEGRQKVVAALRVAWTKHADSKES